MASTENPFVQAARNRRPSFGTSENPKGRPNRRPSWASALSSSRHGDRSDSSADDGSVNSNYSNYSNFSATSNASGRSTGRRSAWLRQLSFGSLNQSSRSVASAISEAQSQLEENPWEATVAYRERTKEKLERGRENALKMEGFPTLLEMEVSEVEETDVGEFQAHIKLYWVCAHDGTRVDSGIAFWRPHPWVKKMVPAVALAFLLVRLALDASAYGCILEGVDEDLTEFNEEDLVPEGDGRSGEFRILEVLGLASEPGPPTTITMNHDDEEKEEEEKADLPVSPLYSMDINTLKQQCEFYFKDELASKIEAFQQEVDDMITISAPFDMDKKVYALTMTMFPEQSEFIAHKAQSYWETWGSQMRFCCNGAGVGAWVRKENFSKFRGFGTNGQHRGAEDTEIAVALQRLGLAHKEKKDMEKAKKFLEQALEVKRTAHGVGHQKNDDIAETLNLLGLVHYELDDFETAMTYYQQALSMQRFLHGDQNRLDIAKSFGNLGIVYNNLQDFTMAKSYCEDALKMKRVVYGADVENDDIAETLASLGVLYKNMQHFEEAVKYDEQALAMYQATLGEESGDPRIIDVIHRLAVLQEKLGNRDAADEYRLKAALLK